MDCLVSFELEKLAQKRNSKTENEKEKTLTCYVYLQFFGLAAGVVLIVRTEFVSTKRESNRKRDRGRENFYRKKNRVQRSK